MIGALDAIVTLGSVIVPPAFDFIKKKFIKASDDTPERTLGTLATTNPEVLPEFIQGMAELLKAKKEYFNRDVIGMPSAWVVNLRASIRPIVVILSLCLFFLNGFEWFTVDKGILIFCEVAVGSWMGSRLNRT